MAEKLKVGDAGKFKTSCGQEITGVVVGLTESGYVVKGDGAQSNLHEDGLFRFTFT
jgi:hypothetical protein